MSTRQLIVDVDERAYRELELAARDCGEDIAQFARAR